MHSVMPFAPAGLSKSTSLQPGTRPPRHTLPRSIMFRTLRWMLVPCALAVIFAAPQSDKQSDKPAAPQAQPWKEKPAADWTEDEAKQVLTKSPWAQEAKPDFS